MAFCFLFIMKAVIHKACVWFHGHLKTETNLFSSSTAHPDFVRVYVSLYNMLDFACFLTL